MNKEQKEEFISRTDKIADLIYELEQFIDHPLMGRYMKVVNELQLFSIISENYLK